MQLTTLRARSLVARACLVSLCMALPLGAAAFDRPYVLYAPDGRALHSIGPSIWLGERGRQLADAHMGFRLEPLEAPADDVMHGDHVWIRSEDGRYLTHWGGWALLTWQRQHAQPWQVTRAAGTGPLTLGEAFALRTDKGRLELATRHGHLAVRHAREHSAPWSLGCHFSPGPFAERWSDEALFEVANGERAEDVSRAVDWLRNQSVPVRMPSGDLPLIVWDDPTLEPDPTVGYLITDTLWAAKALQPYDPELSDSMQSALLSAGWYGNGLNDTLFHGVSELAHRPASDDVVHGTLVDRCTTLGEQVGTAQLHVPEVSADPTWTEGNSSQFIDSALYTALNDFWYGDVEGARARVREVIVDRRGSGSDKMFWDNERWILVDQASRCDYDGAVGACSAACPSCRLCEGEGCRFNNASFKLGLLLYAARVTGLSSERALRQRLADIEYRLWEGQHEDGGLAHLMYYEQNGALADKTGSTGEATAVFVLSQSVQVSVD